MSGDLPDAASLELLQMQLLWSTSAIARLAASAPVAARFASLKALPAALLAALKV